MYKVTVDIDLGAIQQEVVSSIFPVVTQTIASVAEYGANQWRSQVVKARLAPYEKAAYLDSINWKMTGGFSAEISSDYKLSAEIETGRPSRDMKKVLQTSRKVRVSKKGKKYLIIPFRHNIPGNTAHAPAMPAHVYKAAKMLSKSSVTGSGTRLSGSGHLVSQSAYKWGGRLPAGMTPKAKPYHATDLHAGMVRMNTSAGKGKSSAYLTFRVMVEGSPKWIMAARPGLHIAKDVSDNLQPVLESALAKALSLSK